MNIETNHSTQKNLKKVKSNYLYEDIENYNESKNLIFQNSGGLRTKGLYKSFIKNKN